MRPVKLTFQGINSYRSRQQIDFESLTSRGLFGIFGPTGSGKSSILDAMTLALYADLPRNTKKFIHMNETQASVSFDFAIHKDGMDRTYRVERTFRYNKGDSSENVRNIKARLTETTGGAEKILSDQPQDASKKVADLLGLGSDDFMRTVVLPQGKFSEFLQLKNTERRNMLQRIFHLDEYGKELMGKLSRAHHKQEGILAELNGKLSGYENDTAEVLSNTKKELAAREENLEDLQKKKEKVEGNYEEARKLREILEDYNRIKEEKEKLAGEKAAMEALSLQIEESEKANRIRPFVQSVKDSREKVDSLSGELRSAQSKYEIAEKAYEESLKEQEEHSLYRDKRLEEMRLLRPLLLEGVQLQNRLKEAEGRQKKLSADISKTEEEIKEAKSKEKQLREAEGNLKDRILTLEKSLEQNRVSAERRRTVEDGAAKENDYRTRHSLYTENLENYNRRGKNLVEKKEEQEVCRIKLLHVASSLSRSMEEQNHLSDKRQKDLEKCRKQLSELKESVQKWQQTHMASILQKDLKEGEPCPVCGSVHHTISGSEYPVYAEGKEEEFKKEEERVEKEKSTIQEEIGEIRIRLTELSGLLKSISDLGITAPASGEEDLPDLPETFSLPASFASLKKVHASLVDSWHQITATIGSEDQTILETGKKLEEEHTRLSGMAESIKGLRKQAGISDFSEEQEKIRKADAEASEQQKERSELRERYEKKQKEREAASLLLGNLKTRRDSSLQELKICETSLKGILSSFPAELKPEDDHQAALNKLDEEQARMDDKDRKLRDKAAGALEEKNKCDKKKEGIRSALKGARDTFEEAMTRFKEQASLIGIGEGEDFEKLYRPEEILAEEKEQIRLFKEREVSLNQSMEDLEKKRNGRTMTEQAWEAVKNERDDILKAEKELVQSLAVTKQKLTDLKVRLGEKKELEKILKGEKETSDRISELYTLFRGNAFVEYAAMSRLKYIAREASDILMQISGGSYNLRVNDNSEFVIRDNKNGGVIRPSDTLSGGEIFITSLALALALSSSIQLGGAAPLEFFFLDEGFGSLDDDLLDVVMNSLASLPRRKGSIGIISHVQSIESRVPRKLIVTPSSREENGSQIHMELT